MGKSNDSYVRRVHVHRGCGHKPQNILHMQQWRRHMQTPMASRGKKI